MRCGKGNRWSDTFTGEGYGLRAAGIIGDDLEETRADSFGGGVKSR